MKKLIKIFLTVVILTCSGLVLSQDIESRNTDIEILTDVLEKLLTSGSVSGSFGSHWNSDVNGFYLNDFGYLFKTSTGSLYFSDVPFILRAEKLKLEKIREKLAKRRVTADSLSFVVESMQNNDNLYENSDSLYQKAMTGLKKQITEFMAKYASTLTPSFNNEKISVIVDLGTYSSGSDRPKTLTAWALISDLNKLRAQRGSWKKFIHFTTSDNKISETDRQIEIFEDILHRYVPSARSGSSGTYYRGIGAIFFLNTSSLFSTTEHSKSLSVIYNKKTDKNSGIYIPMEITSRNTDKNTQDKSEQEFRKELINQIKNAIVRYGHTIDIKDQEKIVILLNTDSAFNFMHKTSIPPTIIQVQKKYINDFIEGRITKNQLKKKISVTDYQ